MRHSLLSVSLLCCLALAACQKTPSQAELDRALRDVNVIDESNLTDMMLTLADPGESVSYFKKTSTSNPERIDLLRGLAKSLLRAKDNDTAIKAWERVAAHPEATADDRVDWADSLIRLGRWAEAEAILAALPPTQESFKRYRVEAIVADSKHDWRKADAFYESAISLTTTPATTYNNWGYSKMSRGDFSEAERLFSKSLSYDPTLFAAKNNLVMARAGLKKYDLPVVKMSQQERAELLYTMALTAIKQGDSSIGKSLLRDAIDTHPQHFEAAARALGAIEG